MATKSKQKKISTKKTARVVKTVKPKILTKKKTTKVVKKTVSKTVGPKTVYHSVTMEALFDASAHLGHLSRKWNPKMKEYIWQGRGGVHIIDLEKTVLQLDVACKVLEEIGSKGGFVVMVGTKRQAQEVVKEAGIKTEGVMRDGLGFVAGRWLGGLVTNWKQMKKRIDYMYRLKEEKEKGEWEHYTKKEKLLKDREVAKLERMFAGVDHLKNRPDALVVVDVQKEKTAVREGKNAGLVMVGLIDTNVDPNQIDYPIPMNDDSHDAIGLVVNALADAVERGRRKFEAQVKSADDEAEKSSKK